MANLNPPINYSRDPYLKEWSLDNTVDLAGMFGRTTITSSNHSFYSKPTVTIKDSNEITVGYFKFHNDIAEILFYTEVRPTQETLDELYDTFGWTYHDS